MSKSSMLPIPCGSAGSTTRWSPYGSSPSIVRSSSGPRLAKEPAPQKVAVVRGQRVDLLAVGGESRGEVAALPPPEVLVEASFEVGRLLLQPLRERRVPPDQPRQAAPADLRVV